jgi:ABC-type multidrug transport system fused ATPase/permease subunit
MAQVEEIARLTGLADFAEAQPAGYRTRLGRGGATLDTEQLARLGMARALIVQPAVLTVDDTFAALEEPVEEALRAAVRGFLADRTLLIATSRLSVCEDADLVVVMRQGGVEQLGTHAELMAVPGLYRRMHMRQRGIAAVEQQTKGSGTGDPETV